MVGSRIARNTALLKWPPLTTGECHTSHQHLATSRLVRARVRLSGLNRSRCCAARSASRSRSSPPSCSGQLGAAVFTHRRAVSVGFGLFQGAYRSRAGVMLLASAAMALSILRRLVHRRVALIAIGAAAVWAFAAAAVVFLGLLVRRTAVNSRRAAGRRMTPRTLAARCCARRWCSRADAPAVFVVAIWPCVGFTTNGTALVRCTAHRWLRPQHRRTEFGSSHPAAEIPGAAESTATLTRSRVAKRRSSRHCSMKASASWREPCCPCGCTGSPGGAGCGGRGTVARRTGHVDRRGP